MNGQPIPDLKNDIHQNFSFLKFKIYIHIKFQNILIGEIHNHYINYYAFILFIYNLNMKNSNI